jgi:hypothetical protein
MASARYEAGGRLRERLERGVPGDLDHGPDHEQSPGVAIHRVRPQPDRLSQRSPAPPAVATTPLYRSGTAGNRRVRTSVRLMIRSSVSCRRTRCARTSSARSNAIIRLRTAEPRRHVAGSSRLGFSTSGAADDDLVHHRPPRHSREDRCSATRRATLSQTWRRGSAAAPCSSRGTCGRTASRSRGASAGGLDCSGRSARALAALLGVVPGARVALAPARSALAAGTTACA